MPYEATVPVHRRLLWPAVTDAERLIGALPNASIDASGAQGVAGRFRVRTREQTITFRGVARIVDVVPASLRVSLEVEAVFGRAGGTVEGLVEIALRQSGSGTRVLVDGQLDIAPGAAPLPAEALDSAFKRVVQRWFTALAETSPAKKPSPGVQADQADEASEQQGEAQQADERPPRRASERAPLAVVRDPAEEQAKTENGRAAAIQASQAPAPEPQESNTSASNTSASNASAPNGRIDRPAREPDDETTPQPRSAEPYAHAPLRLVTPGPESADDRSDAAAAGAGDRGPAFAAQDANDPAEPEPDDIWSRLRDRSLPPWIPFLVGAATATLAAVGFVFAALRRRYRR